MAYAPRIDPQTIKNLRVIAQLYEENPEYFKETEYSSEIRELVRDLVHKASAPSKQEGSELLPKTQTYEPVDVVEETTVLYRDLKAAKPTNGDPAALMSFFRTSTSLLEKLLDQIREAEDMKKLSEFYSTILNFMESTLTPEQRASFQELVKDYAQK